MKDWLEKLKSKREGSQTETTIKTGMFRIPVIVVIITMIAMTWFMSFRANDAMIDEKIIESEILAENVYERINENNNTYSVLEQVAEDSILGALEVIVDTERDLLSTNYLQELANAMQIDEINLFESNSLLVQSNMPENPGHIVDSDHAVSKLHNSSDRLVIEEIRESVLFDDHYIYGAIKNSDGSILQLGKSVNNIVEMQKDYGIDRIVAQIGESPGISFLGWINTDLITVTNTEEEFIGQDMSDYTGIVESSKDGEIHVEEVDHNGEGVLQVTYPTYRDGELEGYINLGVPLAGVKASIRTTAIWTAIFATLSAIVLIIILYKSTNKVISTLYDLRRDSLMMAEGDFSMDVPEEFQADTSEFGQIARANQALKESVRGIVGAVANRAETVASFSQELTATAQSSEHSAMEVSGAVNDMANAAMQQAEDIEAGQASIINLDKSIDQTSQDISSLNCGAEEVNKHKDEGLTLVDDLVKVTEDSRDATNEVKEIITETEESTREIIRAIDMIQDIAEQTNLLALNASIEAARAGEHGRGFAVVAEEIRQLAEQSNQFSGDIQTIVDNLTGRIGEAVRTMDALEEYVDAQGDSVEFTSGKFDGIAQSVDNMRALIDRVFSSSDDIVVQKDNIASMIENLAALSEENAAGTEEVSASVEEQTGTMNQIAEASENLAEIAEELNTEVMRFTI